MNNAFFYFIRKQAAFNHPNFALENERSLGRHGVCAGLKIPRRFSSAYEVEANVVRIHKAPLNWRYSSAGRTSVSKTESHGLFTHKGFTKTNSRILLPLHNTLTHGAMVARQTLDLQVEVRALLRQRHIAAWCKGGTTEFGSV